MSVASKADSTWRPSAGVEQVRARNRLLAGIRQWFEARGVLEVETPCMSIACATDPCLEALQVHQAFRGNSGWLQTSPEFHMKRLLADGFGDIYQIFRAFRRGESGRIHNPEFAMLEWYRTGMDLNALVHDTCALVSDVTGLARGQQYSWYQLMQDCLGCHPDRATEGDFKCVLDAAGMTYPALGQKSDWFDLVFSHLVQPRLGMGEDGQPCLDVVIGYPVEMASLAKLAPAGSDEWVALRFEAYLGGMEIANGYEELTDPVEQRRRFEADNAARARLGLGARPVDHRLLAALEAGLPDCAGVALGLDRLLLCSLGLEALDQVLLFPAEIA